MMILMVVLFIAGVILMVIKRRKIALIMFALAGVILLINVFMVPSYPKGDGNLVHPAGMNNPVSVGYYTISLVKASSRLAEQYYDPTGKVSGYTTRVVYADIRITCNRESEEECDQKIKWEIGSPSGPYFPLYPDKPINSISGGETIEQRIRSREIKATAVPDEARLRVSTSSDSLIPSPSRAIFSVDW